MGMGGGSGTVDPFDVQPFLSAEQSGSQFGGVMNGDAGGEAFHFPHESTTTAADVQGGMGMDDEEGAMPMTLLKMLGALGGGGR
jgi:hypothetical protein